MKILFIIILSVMSTISVTTKKNIEPKDLFVYERGKEHSQTILFLHGSGSCSIMRLKQIPD